MEDVLDLLPPQLGMAVSGLSGAGERQEADGCAGEHADRCAEGDDIELGKEEEEPRHVVPPSIWTMEAVAEFYSLILYAQLLAAGGA
ncbi:hypothetical protein E2562_019639 [Oryza meyeriana var. granulata]|uniref:Uncharacterized protein n=1 Tax=Oryza meyeriana var. granulata TaxID=110450 RepID=A0A6G1C7X5_9ORYZ|nr:hypothetical protein E2562_019639 [Oryza meyeriana var. granulata]